MAPEVELLPCPFCGEKATGPHVWDYEYESGDCYIECSGCGARTEFLKGGDVAAEAWNRRAP